MSSPLQKAPLGILGAFALKVLGKNPDKFGDTITPEVDVYDQYLARELRTVVVSGTITNPSTSAILAMVVPNGFSYRILNVSIEASVLVADVALVSQMQITIGGVEGGFSYLLNAVSPNVFAGAAAGRIEEFYLPRPLFLPAGARLNGGIILSAAPAVAMAVALRALVQLIEE